MRVQFHTYVIDGGRKIYNPFIFTMGSKLLTRRPKLFSKNGDIHKGRPNRKVIHSFGKLSTKCIDLLTKVSKKTTLRMYPEREVRKALGAF